MDSKNNKEVAKRVSGSNILSIFFNAFKKISAVSVIYMVGYMQWSAAWFITPIVLLVIRDHFREEKQLKSRIAQATALANEKDVVLARLDDLPAWVFFPDIERAEWLNRIFKQVWPTVNSYAKDLIRDKIQPNVQKKMEKYKMNGFKFERIILGSIPPRIGGVKVYDSNVGREEIIMDVDIFYAGDCDISFSVSGVRGGIKDFQMHGMIRIVMKPLLSRIPLIGGLQVFFLNNPSIDFNLVGVADVLDMPGLSDLLRRIITEQVASMMVLPNKFPIKLTEEVEAETLKVPVPEGVLRLHVVEAKNLMKKDIGMLGKGKSDPYAVINVGAQEFRTKTITNTVDPKWDYWCEFNIMDTEGQQLFLHLWDFDETSNDENLGRASVPLSNVVKKGEADMWVTLEQAKHGLVHIRLTWLKLSSNYSDLNAAVTQTQLLRVTGMSTALLTIYIDSARYLPQARSERKPDSFVMVQVGKEEQQTEVKMRTCDPVWEQGFSFLVSNPETDTLHLSVMDQKTGNKLGQLSYNLNTLADKPKLESQKQPFSLLKAGPDSKIIFSLSLRILKHEDDEVMMSDGPGGDAPLLLRENSKASTGSSTSSGSKKEQLSDNIFNKTESLDEVDEVIPPVSSTLLSQSSPGTISHRHSSMTLSPGDSGLGRIELTLRYAVPRQRLVVVVHKVANLPLKDPTNIPDPYVKLYLLPARSKETKRKTHVIKDNCNPVFDETFEYVMSQGELSNHTLEVTVATQKPLLSSASNIMGQVLVDLYKLNLTQAYTAWFDLQPAKEQDD